MVKSINIVAAIAQNGVIGNKGKIPWNIPEDMERFKQLTLNHPVIMGRITFESILERLGKPLPERTNIVITSQLNRISTDRIRIAKTLKEAIEISSEINQDVYVIGGQRVYEETMPIATHLYLTRIHESYYGDRFFPKIKPIEWEETNKVSRKDFTFADYKRRYHSV